MGYPSLLYFVKPQKKPLSISVFEDLQLLNFIPESVAKAVRVPCEKENILPRQALFAALEDEGARERTARLYELSEEVFSLDKAYRRGATETEKDLLFFFLCEAELRFAAAAAECSYGDPLSERFAAAFGATVASSRYRTMKETVLPLLSEAEELLHLRLFVHGERLHVGGGGGATFLSRIEACAATLGVESPKVRCPEAKRLSPDLIAGVAKLSPTLMKKLAQIRAAFAPSYDADITYYRKELRFYLTMLSFFDRIREAGIPLTFPTPVEGRCIAVTEAYDVSLLAKNETNIIPNDISFTEEEPFFFLTGANGGGKTTYLRAVGIAAVLYLLGCPVPCLRAEFGEVSSVFTHFPRDERFDGSGRFVEEDNRAKEILALMDERSLVLLNETYATTNEENAVRMTERLASELHRAGTFGLYITHQHALSLTEIPYLNVLVDRDDSNRRTFKIVRQKATGGSFAKDILEKCGLTYEALERRFGPLTEREEGT